MSRSIRQPSNPCRRVRLPIGALLVVLGGIGVGCRDTTLSPAARPAPSTSKTGDGIPGNWLSTPRLFSSGASVARLAVTPSMALASTRGPSATKLVTLTEAGTARPFAPGFVASEDAVCPLEVAPGIGDFPQGLIYVGLGRDIWQLSADGTTIEVFARLPEPDGSITGLAFDTVGGFGYELLALTDRGAVDRIDPQGASFPIGSVGPGANGPSVAPALFGIYAGQLLLAFPDRSEVRAIDAAGNVNTVVYWSGVSGAFALSENPRAYGRSGGGAFFATADGQVYEYPLADLEARRGQVLLTSKYRSGSGIVYAEPGGYRMLPFARSMGPEIAAGVVRRPSVTRVTVELFPGVNPKVLTVGSTIYVPTAVYAAVGFDPAILSGGEIRLAGAAPVSKTPTTPGTYGDLNGDGRTDLLLRFRASEMQVAPGATEVLLEAQSLAGDRVQGTGQLLVQAP